MSARRGLAGLIFAVGALTVAGACSGGLKVDEGNPFPCDYAKAEEVRDTACAPGWRCGIDSHCHEDVPEAATLGEPPDTPASTRVYPKLLAIEPRFIAADSRGERVLVGSTGDALFTTNGFSARQVGGTPSVRAAFVGGRVALQQVTGGIEATGTVLALGSLEEGAGGVSASPVQPQVKDVRALRAATLPDAGSSLLVARTSGQLGEVDVSTGTYTDFPGGFGVQTDGGVCVAGSPLPGCSGGATVLPLLDARPVPASDLMLDRSRQDDVLVPVVATRDFFFWRKPGTTPGGDTWQVLNPDDPVSREGISIPGEPLLRHGEGATVWGLRRSVRESASSAKAYDVLSTWTLRRTSQGPRLERAWDDCAPCAASHLVTFTPVSDGAVGVEVLCESDLGTRALFRVVGASVTSPANTCLRQLLDAPVDLSEIATTVSTDGRRVTPGAVDDSRGEGLALGGAHGQLWVGRTLSTLRPIFLDRAPLAVGTLEVGPLGDTFAALTPDFLALRFNLGAVEPEGLTVVDRRQGAGGASEPARLAAVVRETPGWLVLESGQLVKVSPADGSLGNAYGPQLLAPNGEPAQGPFLGQGIPATQTQGASMVLTANDQLYVLDSAKLEAEPGAQPGLLPRLTPDPGFPIRSLARDRTVDIHGTTGPKVRGWLSTGRGLFEYQQSADGLWSLTPLPLGNGEPVEVWGRESGATTYGRVGLRDGQVLKLPTGVPLTQPLPGRDFVVDYASLDGWPVALGEQGLYVTESVRRTNGQEGLLRWRALSLPGGLTSTEDLKGARIEVVREPGTQALLLFTRTGAVYRLATAR
ncbi:hypothetical protein JY651_39080 [Pyxidicoccus parkwayensis]|uniref:Lipoprotein n=1 Tax=Pyxidicoccus parkwayensis TaxID=2813578 RepID=A0ABX7NQK7_9BACT|nr:hypothetical protein [Pyxidicoccus parkwaysis]QSQ21150.1 hypothetical protein JY651_39080 [Pyxidicoccus parkwaysis]